MRLTDRLSSPPSKGRHLYLRAESSLVRGQAREPKVAIGSPRAGSRMDQAARGDFNDQARTSSVRGRARRTRTPSPRAQENPRRFSERRGAGRTAVQLEIGFGASGLRNLEDELTVSCPAAAAVQNSEQWGCKAIRLRSGANRLTGRAQ